MVPSSRVISAFIACLVLTPLGVAAQDDRLAPDPAHPFDPYALSPQQDDRSGEVITPRHRRFDLGPTVIGPGGVIPAQPELPRQAEAPKPKPKPQTPAERAEAIRKALAPRAPFAQSRKATLDTLYAKLAKASDVEEAKGIATLIGNIWIRTNSDTAALLMQRAMAASDRKDYPVALDLLDRIVALEPTWTEAWNKRASVRFAAGNLDGAMADVEHVLKLDPNHFAALEGMGMILQRTGMDKRALQVYRRALAIYPHQPAIEEIVKTLGLQVEGQGI